MLPRVTERAQRAVAKRPACEEIAVGIRSVRVQAILQYFRSPYPSQPM